MNIVLSSEMQSDSIVDGEGLRTVIWTQGCPHKCKGCHNPETHSFKGGVSVPIKDLINKISKLKQQDGITLSGGEPFSQAEACTEIAKAVKKKGMNVWCYSGYTYEELLKLAAKDNSYMKLLESIDVLIDGRFILEEKTYDVLYRGSRNQRIIDVPKSLKNKKVMIIEKYEYLEAELSNYQKVEGVFV